MLLLDATCVHLLLKLSLKLLLGCLQFVEEDERRDRGDEDNVDDRFIIKGGGESRCWMILPDKLRSVIEIGVTHVVGLMAIVVLAVALLLLSLVMDIIVCCWCCVLVGVDCLFLREM